MITSGNIITLCISLVLIILFRQLDKNNRSIEKVKKFGDKLKAEIEVFIKERSAALQESSIALDVQQAKAVAAVKRLESIREDMVKKEAELVERTASVSSIGKQFEAYDATIKQLLEMTALAEVNLSKITAESDFADSIGKKLLASQKQLSEIAAAIPSLQESFTKENKERFSSIQSDTLAKISHTITDLETRVETAHRSGTEIASSATEKLKEVYQKAFAEASRKADTLEDAAFVKLKEQASERLAKYKETVEEKTSTLHELTKEKLQETQGLVKNFKSEWLAESSEILESTRVEIAQLGEQSESAVSRLEQKIKTAEYTADMRTKEMQGELQTVSSSLSASLKDLSSRVDSAVTTLETEIQQKIHTTASLAEKSTEEINEKLRNFEQNVSVTLAGTTSGIEKSLDSYRTEVDYRLTQFSKIITDVDHLDEQLHVSMQATEKRVSDEFVLYTQDQQARQDSFEKKLLEESDAVSGRMRSLETGLNELKARAYDNVSEKLKMFEDDFFTDLAKRSDAITDALAHWKTNVDERLESLSAESESGRKDIEAKYAGDLKERLAQIGEQYRQQTAKLEEQMSAVETDLRTQITASDQAILSFVEQFRAEFAQTKATAELHIQNELGSHSLGIQEILRKQEREVEGRTKVFIDTIENAKSDSEAALQSIRTGFTSWQTKNDMQLAEAKTLFSDKISAFEKTTNSSIADLDTAYQTNYRDFVAQTAAERKQLKDNLDAMKVDISSANIEFEKKSTEAIAAFNKAYETMAAEKEKRIRETSAETDQNIRSLKTIVADLREKLEQTQDKLMQKIQNDTNILGATLEEIDKKQKAFISQTRIFDRADELKVNLESNIENLKSEITRLDVYRETMRTLEQQYAKIKKLEEEAGAKVARFMAEKKRIDILESDFNKLLGLSDSIDKKVSELTLTNDDLQQYQVQIRRFEESVSEVNSRYERLEKKAVVLDQTASGVDKAFENLKSLETSLHDYRQKISGIPTELSGIKNDIETLLVNKEKTSMMVEKLSNLDTILEDVEKRTDKMQTSREWLARTETRLEDISKQSEDQLKLLRDLIKDEGAAKKTKGAPPIGIRENVVKLTHQGWTVDEIARGLHLSRGEIELILELPPK